MGRGRRIVLVTMTRLPSIRNLSLNDFNLKNTTLGWPEMIGGCIQKTTQGDGGHAEKINKLQQTFLKMSKFP